MPLVHAALLSTVVFLVSAFNGKLGLFVKTFLLGAV